MMLGLGRVQDASGSAERAEPTLAIGLTITLMLPASGPQAIAERLYVKVASSAAESRASQEPGQRPPQITQIRRSRSLQALPGKPSPLVQGHGIGRPLSHPHAQRRATGDCPRVRFRQLAEIEGTG